MKDHSVFMKDHSVFITSHLLMDIILLKIRAREGVA